MLVIEQKAKTVSVEVYVGRRPDGAYRIWTAEEDQEFPEIRELCGMDPENDPPRLTIQPYGNPAFNAFVREKSRRYQKALGQVPPDTTEKIVREAVANHVLVGWEGIASPDGPAEYTPEAAFELLGANEDFLSEVVSAAMREQNFRALAVREEAAAMGNGPGGSTTGSRKSKTSSTQD